MLLKPASEAAHPVQERRCRGPRGGRGRQGGWGAGRQEHPPRLSLRPQEGLQQGQGSCWGGVTFLPPKGCVRPHGLRPGWGHFGLAPRGSRLPTCPPTVPGVDAGPRLPAHCLSAGPSSSARGCWAKDPAGGATERAEERQTPPAGTTASPRGAWGGPPVSSRAYPPAAHRPPCAPFPTQHWVWDPPILPSSQRACSRGFWEQTF